MSAVRLVTILVAAMHVCSNLRADEQNEFPMFVGWETCVRCHHSAADNKACSVHPIGEHDYAYRALAKPQAAHIAALCGIADPPQESRICLSCHATGADEGRRWTLDTFRISDGVQCEACHGAGSLHVESARSGVTNTPPQIRVGDRSMCVICHVDRPSHRAVLIDGYRLPSTDTPYKTPVNLVVTPSGERVFVACESSDSVVVIEPSSGDVVAEIAVGAQPHDATISPDGQTVYVANRRGDSVSVIDATTLSVTEEIGVGDEPHGVLLDSTGRVLFVLNTEQNTVSVIDTATHTELYRLATGRGPWSLARGGRDDSMLITSVRPDPVRFQDPPVSELTVLSISPVTGGPSRIVVERRTEVPQANMLQGIAAVPGRDVVLFTLMRTKNRVPLTRLAQGWTITNGLGLLWSDGRIDQVLLDLPNDSFPDPMDVAVRPDGKYALVTSGGSDQLAVVDIDALLKTVTAATDRERREVLPNHLGLSSEYVVKRLKVGINPRGVTFSPDGRFAYVANALEDSVSVIDAERFVVVKTIPLGGPETVTQVRWGEQLFHSAANAFGRQFSCRSCHPDGHVNGLTFDIEADGIGINPVDNRTLRGIIDTAPFKWEGINPSLHRQCGPRLAVFFTRLDPFTPDELNALVRYECTIRRPPNRHRHKNGLTTTQRRGKAVFERTHANNGDEILVGQRCVTCHRGAYKATTTPANVGTTMWLDWRVEELVRDLHDIAEFGNLGIIYHHDTGTSTRTFDVPHLINVYNGAPYLHNGSAATLEEIWTRFNPYDRHGMTSDLTRRQFNDLIAYLKAL